MARGALRQYLEENNQNQETGIKLRYPASCAQAAVKLIKTDPNVQALQLEPIMSPKERHYIRSYLKAHLKITRPTQAVQKENRAGQ